jgi:hypothetical protein
MGMKVRKKLSTGEELTLSDKETSTPLSGRDSLPSKGEAIPLIRERQSPL